MVNLLLSIAVSYFLGSIPFALVITKLFKGVDIRKLGSGNVGATNVYRTVSKPVGVIVLILDAVKGFLAVAVISGIFYKMGPNEPVISLELFRILSGAASICGHNWTIFLRFKGGKGIATSTGVLLALAPKALLISATVWFIVVLISHYVSLASILASAAFPAITAILGYPKEIIILTITLAIISGYKHKTNISRLISGKEAKIW